MKIKKVFSGVAIALAAALAAPSAAVAADVLCQDITKNHMFVSDAYVISCVDAGLGNIGQGGGNDVFLADPLNVGYMLISQYATFDSDDWSIPAGSWGGLPAGQALFLGFKFGTGNTPDEWFVYELKLNVTAGTYDFNGLLVKGNGEGGLSHLALYKGPGDGGGDDDGDDDDEVPEPASVALLGLGLLALAATRRRKQ
jgi:PEP-CTERM motif